MKVVALISGGKDSCYSMLKCVEQNHEIVALANLYPTSGKEEDSYMFQTVGHEFIQLYAEAMDLPLFRREISGKPLNCQSDYLKRVDGDEVEDLFELLNDIKKQIDFQAISVGAIFSDYQRVRAENICQRLNVQMLAPLWHRDQVELLNDMINDGINAIIIKVAVLGLEPNKHLGRSIKEMYDVLVKLKDQFGINVCGEGGEYETMTLDCPLFKKKIVM